mmetsp:Transcript_32740/g.89636  ORF Transcript_32740/g.89636 Transcript_32740/m.89636 type:complete len:93 (+) Transcript_32740:249-527(+)
MGGSAWEAPREVTSCAIRHCVCGGTLLHRSTLSGAMAVCKGGTLASRWPCNGRDWEVRQAGLPRGHVHRITLRRLGCEGRSAWLHHKWRPNA